MTLILASAANILVWVVWVAAAAACLGSGVAVICSRTRSTRRSR